MFRLLRGCLAMAALVLGVSAEASGATITLAPHASTYATPALSSVYRTIRITGLIERGDAAKLQGVLVGLSASKTMPPQALIVAELSGDAGDYDEAMKLGGLLRDFLVTTVVRKGDRCLSACVLVFLGGTSRQLFPDAAVPSRFVEVGGRVGFRNYYGGASAPQSEAGRYPVRALLAYSERMGVERGFIARLLAIGYGQSIDIDTVDEFLVFRACPIGLGGNSGNLEVQATNVCNQSTPWFDPATHLTVKTMTDAEIRRQQLDFVVSNIWWLGVIETKSTLADRLNSREYKKSDAAAVKLYADLKMAGIPLLSLIGTNFEVSGYTTGFYRMRCLVSLSPTDGEKSELIFQGQHGMTSGARSAPEQCRGLLRLDRNEEINPVMN